MNSMRLVYIILFLACQHTVTLSTEHYSLYKKLFLDQDYNPELRPVKNVTQAVDVQLEYRMTAVDDLDETREFLSSAGWLKIRWRDEFLAWNISRFNLESIKVPAENAWGPDLVLGNVRTSSVRIPKQGSMIILFSNGSIIWWVSANWQTKCRINVSKFPFDSQTCPIVIGQLATQHKEVAIVGHTSGKLDVLFKRHGEWKITNLSLVTNMDDYDGELMSRITVNVVITRRPLYHIITYILPVVALSVLNLATFLVPVEYGEKVSLCVSVLLSYAVFLSSITSDLPKVSDTVSIFGIYLLVMLLAKVASCFIAVLVLKVYQDGDTGYHRVLGINSNDQVQQKVTSADKARTLNRYSFFAISGLTTVLTISFLIWMTHD